MVPTKLDFEKIIDPDVWVQHWKNWEQIQGLMRMAQRLAAAINVEVADAYKKLRQDG